MVDVTPVIPPTPIPPTPAGNGQSVDIPPSDNQWKIHPLTEQCALGRRIAVWESPKFPDYNNKHSRLATFDKWPHGMNPSPASLVRAGFYFTGMYMT